MNVSLFLLLCCPDARSTCASERSIDSQCSFFLLFKRLNFPVHGYRGSDTTGN